MASASNNSSSVLLDNVDDYLAPSQACINPLFQPKEDNKTEGKSKETESSKNGGGGGSGSGSGGAVVPRRRRRVVRRKVVEHKNDQEQFNAQNEDAVPLPSAKDNVTTQTTKNTAKSESETKDVVKASMADCLACSGCVTTAETVLMEQHHSLTSLRQRLMLNPSTTNTSSDTSSESTPTRLRALTVSPNALADLCRHWKINAPSQTHLLQLTTMLHRALQVNIVVDGNIPLEWTWRDEAQEFVEQYHRKRNKEQQQKEHHHLPGHGLVQKLENAVTNSGTSSSSSSSQIPPPSVAIDATKTMYYLPGGKTQVVSNQTIASSSVTKHPTKDDDAIPSSDAPADPYYGNSENGSSINNNNNNNSDSLPLISGSCPALVCLVEKSMHSLVPHLSRALSPMSRMGWAMKMTQRNQCKWDHWAVMPCHDKKLEASRKDFVLQHGHGSGSEGENNTMVPAVDLVITTVELVELLEEWRNNEYGNHTTTDKSSSMKDFLESFPVAKAWNSTPGDDSIDPSKAIQSVQNELLIQGGSCNQSETTLYWTNSTTFNPEENKDITSLTTQNDQYKTLALASGGHADYIFRYAAFALFGHEIPDEESIVWKMAAPTTNNTTKENGTKVVIKSQRLANLQKKQQSYRATLYRHQQEPTDDNENTTTTVYYSQTPSSEPVLQFGIVRGMQTMQQALNDLSSTISTSTKTKTTAESATAPDDSLDYLEAMACPHGCINGGGSVRTTTPSSSTISSSVLLKETPTETKARVDQTLHELVVPPPPPSSTESGHSMTMSHPQTRYHVVPPMQHTMGAAAGVKVEDMQW